jgi:multiple antibiotic resistance protein
VVGVRVVAVAAAAVVVVDRGSRFKHPSNSIHHEDSAMKIAPLWALLRRLLLALTLVMPLAANAVQQTFATPEAAVDALMSSLKADSDASMQSIFGDDYKHLIIQDDRAAATVRRIALLATLFASLALAVAAFLGEYFLTSFGIPLPVLALSAGLILLLVALINTLQQLLPHGAAAQSEALRTTTPLQRALSPLAFPTIVTPYGIATLVVFLALATEMQARLTVGAIVVVIMLSNLGVMLLTRHILPLLVVLLPILGAVLGVVQVALGLQIVHRSLMTLGML